MSTASSRGKRRHWALILLLAPLLAGTTYKWRDSEGQLHLTDAPPPPGTAYEVIATPRNPAPTPAPAAPAPSVPAATPAEPIVPVPAVDEAGVAAARAESDRRCVEALYQLELLGMQTRVYKPGTGDTRRYLNDRDRPAEVERLNRVQQESCVGDSAYMAARKQEASGLLQTLTPGCRESREKLEYMRRDPRTPRRDLERKEASV